MKCVGLSFINNVDLLAHTFTVDGFEHRFDEVYLHAAEGTLGTTLVDDFLVALGLHNGYVVLLLVTGNFA